MNIREWKDGGQSTFSHRDGLYDAVTVWGVYHNWYRVSVTSWDGLKWSWDGLKYKCPNGAERVDESHLHLANPSFRRLCFRRGELAEARHPPLQLGHLPQKQCPVRVMGGPEAIPEGQESTRAFVLDLRKGQ